MNLEEKLDSLQRILKDCGSLAVAFSGGTDSSFLLKKAHDVLGDRVLALTVDSVFIPRAEIEEALSFCRGYGIRHKIVYADVLSVPSIRGNPADRCYYCKRALFEQLLTEAGKESIRILAEGSNTDDVGDYRPGLCALSELGIRSPLREAGLGKADIRELSHRDGLDSWDKPSMACLASRIAYGESLSVDKLKSVEKAEALLHSLGICQCRVRVHGPLARIETPPDDFELLIRPEIRRLISGSLKDLGFSYVTLDLTGFRSGSMNEVL